MSWLILLLRDLADNAHHSAGHNTSENQSSNPVEMWIPGNPATFATRGEKPWKDLLVETILPY